MDHVRVFRQAADQWMLLEKVEFLLSLGPSHEQLADRLQPV
jgi:hypothetical protein